MPAPSKATQRKTFPGAPVLTLLLMIFLPAVVYYLYICVQYHEGALAWPGSMEDLRHWVSLIPAPTAASILIFGVWIIAHALLQLHAPGKVYEGTLLEDGTRLKYRMNGLFTFWFVWAVLGLAAGMKWLSPTILYENFGPLVTTANIFAYALALFLYIHGKASKREDGTTGSFFYDFFMGVTLNPRVGSFDFKFFCESRPGLIGWVAINFSLAAQQYRMHGTITTPMIMVCLFHFLYIADYFFHEDAILTTLDIMHDRFGWMLAWGDLVWVPFTYTLQAYYLLHHTHDLSFWTAAGIVALNTAGFLIFRLSNYQKHRFRNNPKLPVWGKPPEYIKTARGSLLLTSGWWGLARHINYFGDLLMALAWCLPCLFGSPVPYFYVTYFTILLVHRERRDNKRCLAKYGKDWETYTQKVRRRIVPGIY
jgi:delta14-sterol reductase